MGRLGDLKQRLFELRGTICESCKLRPATQCAHVFIGTDVRFEKYLAVAENAALVCSTCHGFTSPNDPHFKRVDTPGFRREFMQTQLGRYDMRSWLDSIPHQKRRPGGEWHEADVLLRGYE